MTDQAWFPEDVRKRAADAVRARRDTLVADLDVLVGATLTDPPSGDLRARLVNRTIELLTAGVAGSAVAENPGIADLAGMQQNLKHQELFTAVRLAEGSMLAELSVDPDIGATSDHWPAITVTVRRASFDLLAAVFDHLIAAAPAVSDPRTMLMTRAVFEIAVAKELQRGVRYHHPVAVVLFQMDGLPAINERHGYGVGDLLMERLGVLLQRYFREPDWVVRYGADSVAVLLPETGTRDARALAERARQAIEERLAFRGTDERPVHVTASAAVVTLALKRRSGEEHEAPDAQRVMGEAEAAVNRARARGGNTIECVEVTRDSLSVAEAAARLKCTPAAVRRLIAAGTLPGVGVGGRMRIDRIAVEAYGRRQRPRARRHGS